MKITVCLIATKKYWVFVQPLIDSIKHYFLLNHEIEIVLFTDEIRKYEGSKRVKIIQDLIVSWSFPEVTLRRYEIMASREYQCDYIYYLDVDYLLVSDVDEEIFGNVVAVLHPGFMFAGGGSWCENPKSNAYTYPENRTKYYCGGTQGGKHEYYYPIMKRLKREIEDDEKRGVLAIHNDESHWNKLLSELKSFKVLDCRYCCVEQVELREAWGINHIEPKILALAKNHEEIRS